MITRDGEGARRPRAAVVGAGIAGLAAAHALEQLGYEVRLLEREPELRIEGAGISLWPNALRALERIGLGEVVAESTHRLDEAVTLTPSGSQLSRVPLERIAEEFGPLVSSHRADLLRSLHRRVAAEVEFSAVVEPREGELWLDGERLEAELIVGADGIGSAVREAVAPGISPRSAGYAAWRGVAELGPATPTRASEAMGRGKRFGLVPLSGGRTYWFAVLTEAGPDADLAREFEGWHPPIAEAIRATPEAERSYLPIEDLPPLSRWHRGSTVLVGDAAHAMTPNLGQGAAQALEDVATLAECLRAAGDAPLEDTLASYQRARKRRAESVARQSRQIGRLAQASNPILASLRDVIFRRTPAAVSARQFARILG